MLRRHIRVGRDLTYIWLRRDRSFARALSALFDTRFYRDHNSDVARSWWPARLHYFLYGAWEGRDPHPLFLSSYYLRLNPDVRNSGINPLLHYVLFGAAEGRSPHPKVYAPEYASSLADSTPASANWLAQSPRAAPEKPPQSAPPAANPEDALARQAARLRMMAASRALRDALTGVGARVSVIIPCYNYGKYLWDAIGSVLCQSYPHVEVLVLDDGSTDPETIDVVNRIRHERVTVVRQSNQGLAQTRNNGAAIATGDYLLFLDADDRLDRDAIAAMLYVLQRDAAAYAYSQQRFFGDQELVWGPQRFNRYDLLWSNHPSVCSLMRRGALEAVGGYRSELLYGYEDWEFWVRLSARGFYGALVPAPVFQHRRHGVTMTAEAHERHRFLHSQIRAINSAAYGIERVEVVKREWRPFVSVVIPCYNRVSFLHETLQSLESQTTTDIEVIVVNDGSDDPSCLRCLHELRAGGRVRVLDLPHGGVSAARNAGAVAARSEFLMFLDSDDLLDPTAIEKLGWALVTRPDAAFVYSGTVHFGDITAVCYDEFDAARLTRENYLTVTCIIRRDIFLSMGGHDTAMLDSHEDYDFWLRLVGQGYQGALFREPLFFYRRHSSGLSAERIRAAADAESLSQSVVRRRQEGASLAPLRQPPAALDDPVLSEFCGAMAEALCGLRTENYRRVNAPLPFLPRRWNSEKTVILYLTPSFWVGGAEAFDLRILSCLKGDRFHTIQVACEAPDGKWYDRFKSSADEVFSLERMGPNPEARMSFLRYLLMAKSVDVVFNRNTTFGYELAASWPSVTREVRYVDLLHLHAFGEDWVRSSAPYHRHLDLRYVSSQDLPAYAAAEYGLKASDFSLLDYGCEEGELLDRVRRESLRRSIRERWRIADSAFVVGFIGRLTAQKDPLRWMTVAAEISHLAPAVVFLIVGEGELFDEMREASVRLGVGGRCVWTGYQADGADYTAVMDVLLMTSRYEGLPMVVLHAVSCATPVVSTDVGGVGDCVADGLGIVLHRDAPASEFANAVIRMKTVVHDPSYMTRCAERLASRFTKARMQERLEMDLQNLRSATNRDQRLEDYQSLLMEKPILW
jgi:glycosyltransferase involved in cell wall biosynthesis